MQIVYVIFVLINAIKNQLLWCSVYVFEVKNISSYSSGPIPLCPMPYIRENKMCRVRY